MLPSFPHLSSQRAEILHFLPLNVRSCLFLPYCSCEVLNRSRLFPTELALACVHTFRSVQLECSQRVPGSTTSRGLNDIFADNCFGALKVFVVQYLPNFPTEFVNSSLRLYSINPNCIVPSFIVVTGLVSCLVNR